MKRFFAKYNSLLKFAIYAASAFVSFALLFTFSSIYLIHEREYISRYYVPQYTEDSNSDFAYQLAWTYDDDSLVSVISLFPLKDNPSLPPGVESLPLINTVVASSSALENHKEFIENNYGKIYSTIKNKFANPNDNVVYFFRDRNLLTKDLNDSSIYYGNYSSQGQGTFGIYTYENWAKLLPYLIFFVLVIPSFVFLIYVRTRISKNFYSDYRVYAVIGVSKDKYFYYLFGRGVLYVLLGVLSVAILYAFIVFALGFIPIINFEFPQSSYVPLAILIFVISVFVLPILSCILFFPLSFNLKKSNKKKLSEKLYINVFFVGLILCSLHGIFWKQFPDIISTFIIIVSIVFISIGIRSFISLLLKFVSKIQLNSNHHSFVAVSRRWVFTHTNEASKPVALLAIYIILGVFISNYYSLITSYTSNDVPHFQTHVTRTHVRCGGDDQQCLQTFLTELQNALPDSIIALGDYPTGGFQLVQNTNSKLQSDLIKLQEYVNGGIGEIVLHNNEITAWVYVISPEDSFEKITSIVHTSPYLRITENVGAQDIFLSRLLRDHIVWINVLIVIAYGISLVNILLTYALRAEKEARESALLAKIYDGTNILISYYSKQATFVHIVGGVGAIFVAIFTAQQLYRGSFSDIPWGFICMCIAMSCAVLPIEWWIRKSYIKKYSREWMPGRSIS